MVALHLGGEVKLPRYSISQQGSLAWLGPHPCTRGGIQVIVPSLPSSLRPFRASFTRRKGYLAILNREVAPKCQQTPRFCATVATEAPPYQPSPNLTQDPSTALTCASIPSTDTTTPRTSGYQLCRTQKTTALLQGSKFALQPRARPGPPSQASFITSIRSTTVINVMRLI